MKEEKVSSYQVVMLTAGFFLGTSILMNPAAKDGSDAWFTSLVSVCAGFVIVSITATIAALHPGKSLVNILIFCFGKVAGKVVGFGYFLFAMWLTGVVLLTFSNYSSTISYPETPILYLSICYMLVITFAVKIGLEAICRISEIMLVIMICITLLTFYSMFTDFHPDAFMPMFKNGIVKPAVDGVIGGVLPFAEVFLILNILPNLNVQKKLFKSLSLSVIVAGGVMMLFTIRNVSVLGAGMAARNVFPSAKVFRLMPGIDIIPLLDINVIVLGIMKVSLSLYAQVKILGDLFGLKEFKIYVLPLSALDIIVSVTLHQDFITQLYFANNIVPFAYIPILIVIPLIILIISLIKRERPNDQEFKPE